jgi:hypothetical protein
LLDRRRAPPNDPARGGGFVAVAALVLGIIGTIASFLFFVFGFVLGIPMSIIAILLAIIARNAAVKENQPTAVATAGLVLGVIGLAIGVSMFALCGKMIQTAKERASDPHFRERMRQQRIKNSQEFNEIFNKAIESDQPSPAPGK